MSQNLKEKIESIVQPYIFSSGDNDPPLIEKIRNELDEMIKSERGEDYSIVIGKVELHPNRSLSFQVMKNDKREEFIIISPENFGF
jgi:hypothetical protein